MSENVQVKLESSFESFRSAFTQARRFLGETLNGMKAELKDWSDQAKAESSKYESTIEQMANIVQNRFKGINGAIEGVKTMWAQLAVVVGAGMAMQRAVDDTVRMTTEAQRLGRAMGVSATQASIWNVAIGDVYGTTEEFIGLTQGLNRQLRANEQVLNQVGLVTRDGNGHLRDQNDLVLDALATLRQYQEGTDRNIAAQQLFGRGVDVTNEMLSLNRETFEAAAEKAREFGLVIGKEDVEAANTYRAAMNDVDDIMMAFKKTLGDQLLPVLNDLSGWMNGEGKTALNAFAIFLNIITTLVRGLMLGLRTLYNVIVAVFQTGGEYVSAFGDVLSKVLSGDFAGAQAASEAMTGRMRNLWGDAFSGIASDAAATGDAISESWANTMDDMLGNGSVADSGVEGGGTRNADPNLGRENSNSDAAARQAQAAADRLRLEEYQAKMEMYRRDEEAARGHYDRILAIQQEELTATIAQYGTRSREAEAMRNRIAQTERALRDELAQIEKLKGDANRNAAMARIASEESAAEHALATNQITQEQMLLLQKDFENRRFAIVMEGYQAELALLADKPVQYQQMLNRIAEAQAAHDLRMQELSQTASQQQQQPFLSAFQSMKDGWSQTIAQFITGQMTWREALAALWKQMLASFTQYLAQKLAASRLFAALEIGVQKMVNAILRMLGIQAATQETAVKAGKFSKNIAMNAAEAGAGAANSQASIPYIGPILAIAAMAAIFAAVMGMSSKGGGGGSTPSAAAGFDIPAGVNPLTQLHEKEMVLPQAQADVIRTLSEQGVMGGGDSYNIQAWDGADVRRVLMQYRREVAAAGKQAFKDGAR